MSFLFVAGLLYSSYYDYLYTCENNYFANLSTVNIDGEIYKKEYKNEKYRLYIKNICDKNIDSSYFGALIFCDEDIFPIGSKINVRGELMPVSSPENDGEFNYAKYLKSQKIAVNISADSIKALESPRLCIRESLYRIKTNAIRNYNSTLSDEKSGLLSSICFGDKNELDDEYKEIFSKAGLSHILAVSGLHLSIVGGVLYSALRYFGFSFISSGVVSGTIVVLYGMLCGNPVSLIRAIIMFAFSLSANVFGRVYDMLCALSFSVFVNLLLNPFVIYDAGFVMSYVAILGIALFSSPICNCFYKKIREDNRETNVFSKLILSLIFTITLQVFSYPVMVYYFNRIPVFVIFVNLLVLPILGVLLFLGIVSGLLYLPFLIKICGVILHFYLIVANTVSNIPHSSVVFATPKPASIILYYFLIFIMAKCILEKKMYKGIKVSALLAMCLFLLIINKPRGFRVDMLSVGQGEGIFVQSKENVSFFIDGGSTSKKNVGKYVIEPYLKAVGVGKIDYWLLTHLDDDHINGFIEVANSGYPVKNLCVARAVIKEEKFSEIKEICKNNNIKINTIVAGDSIGTKTMKIEFIHPQLNTSYTDTNDNSLCFLLEYEDFKGVFTGDIGEAQEEDILDSIKKIENVDLLKAAHHGSKNSNSKEWLEHLNPKLVIISAGKNNRYGHPSKDTLDRLSNNSIPYFCTIDSGRIRIKYGGKGMEVMTLK